MPAVEVPVYVYRMYAVDGTLLYVGISHRVAARWRSHRRRHDWWPQIDPARCVLVSFPSRALAEAAEQRAITAERPRYNVQQGYSTHGIDADADQLGQRCEVPALALRALRPRRPRVARTTVSAP
ncbi:MAG: GIY-YIG nuclease family protein [Sporichthyaceae bacterium]